MKCKKDQILKVGGGAGDGNDFLKPMPQVYKQHFDELLMCFYAYWMFIHRKTKEQNVI